MTPDEYVTATKALDEFYASDWSCEGGDRHAKALDDLAACYVTAAKQATGTITGFVAAMGPDYKPWYRVTMTDGRVFDKVAVQGAGGVFRNVSGRHVQACLGRWHHEGQDEALIHVVYRWFGSHSIAVPIADIATIEETAP